MLLKRLEVHGFKSFAKKTHFDFEAPVVAIVGPNGSGKSNVAEAIRFVLGEQSMKSMRGKRGEDMIWNGSNAAPRASRASVTLVFDNTSRFLNSDFDEVLIERIVHRDGENEYRMNGTQVRLKDIQEMVAGANIGASGHHLISQGEADKILAAQPRERRAMLEDALGLTIYQYKKEESIRKLEKTEENIRQAEALRREIAPHLRFLKKQVERVERTEELRASAVERYRVYFKREDAYLSEERARIRARSETLRGELAEVQQAIQRAQKSLSPNHDEARTTEIVTLSKALNDARERSGAAARRAARVAGERAALQRLTERHTVPGEALTRALDEEESALTGAQSLETLRALVHSFILRLRALTVERSTTSELEELASAEAQALAEEKEATAAAKEIDERLAAMRVELESKRQEERVHERELFDLTAVERECEHQRTLLRSEDERLRLEEEEFKRELAEVAPLVGRDVLDFSRAHVPNECTREDQVREKRDLEKLKIRLEEMGVSTGDDVLKEYQEASAREAFLEKELADLAASIVELKSVIENLEKELHERFDHGIKAITVEFERFFSLLFEGGTASLELVFERVRAVEMDEEGEQEPPVPGVEIALTIPRKRIKSLVMLSGGERALTSIALIFAMSSVNPPPFLVLDETDAALDEANSRRYGDMVVALSERCQLVVITHNRETMSRAGILYGVTMGGDGISKVLSVKLEEAVQVAK